MRIWKASVGATCLGVATFAFVALADTWNKKTILTVNEPIQVPGTVMQPGKYVMKLMDSPSNRHIVQIFNEREDQVITTILAIPNYRLQPTGNTEFQWWEVPAGQPKALRAWFYPGDNFGQEFAYPKAAAIQIAAAAQEAVPVTYAETEAELATARVGAVDQKGTEMELERQTQVAQAAPPAAPEAAPEPAPAPVTEAAPAPAPAEEGVRTREELPTTSTPFPMFGLIGLAALGTSVVVRAIASR
ncbi:MAG: hypothetical protein HYS04_08860 [Acidobacteria bacterium]|nr:hypothetical protein [Acidobacteriota bacterium]